MESEKGTDGSSHSETYKMHNGLMLLHAQRSHSVSDVKKSQMIDNSQSSSINYHVRKRTRNNETVFKILEFNRFGINITLKKNNDFTPNITNSLFQNATNFTKTFSNKTENCLTENRTNITWGSIMPGVLDNRDFRREKLHTQQVVESNKVYENTNGTLENITVENYHVEHLIERIKRKTFQKETRKLLLKNINTINVSKDTLYDSGQPEEISKRNNAKYKKLSTIALRDSDNGIFEKIDRISRIKSIQNYFEPIEPLQDFPAFPSFPVQKITTVKPIPSIAPLIAPPIAPLIAPQIEDDEINPG